MVIKTSLRSQRKDDHVAHALRTESHENPFSAMKIVHKSLPGIDLDDVDVTTKYLNHVFAYPIYINAMTGGSQKTLEINRKLAIIARTFNLAMAVGSQHAALDDDSLEPSYRVVREIYPEGFLIANVSANASVVEALRAIAMIDANALGIHVNVAQEITMDEGDRNFREWSENIRAIVEASPVPVVVKEVGFGMSLETVAHLYELGVQHVDLSGRGGTNFVQIENDRSTHKRFDYLLDWGSTALESLIDTKPMHDKVECLASGGVSNPLDVLKCLVLGAKAVGISGMFLRYAHLPEKEMIAAVDMFLKDFKKCMVLVGAQNVESCKKVKYIYFDR